MPAYVHGYTLEPGLPQLPLKGILLDVPAGRQARLEVLDEAGRVLPGYRVYPAPVHQAGAGNQVAEVFRWDEAAYGANALYPAVAAELSGEYVYRGQVKQRLLLYPLRFNPGAGELVHSERIRVRVEYEDTVAAAVPLRAAAAAPMSFMAPSPASGWSPPAGAAFKVSTDGEGITRITRAGLQGAGVADADIDALELSRVQLFHLGAEQAIHVYDQNGNGRLDAADHISFYAAAVPSDYRKYARYNVYWLIDAGSGSPLRMATVDGTPSGGALAASHLCTARHELDQTYLQSAVGPDAMDRWIFSSIAMGAGFAGGGVAKDFTLSLPGALAAGDLTIRMYSPYDLAHETSVSVNGSGVGSATWSGIGWTEAAFPGVSLLDGANTVSLSCTGSLDKTATDWFEVVYARNFAAVSDSLKFTHAGGYRYRVAGFTSADAELYDVTDPAAVVRVVNGAMSGSGPYTLEAEPAGASGARSYLAVASAGLKTPAAVVKDRASSLSAASNAADWILITHRSLGWDGAGAEQGWVTSLAALRQGQGLRTAVVDIEDVFDEFGYGLVTPQAVKDFLTHAYESWQSPAPQYVLLVGDTSYDYKDNWGAGTVNLVPGYLIYTTHLGETISDEWYGQVSGEDAVADLCIGRLPAATLSQAQAMAAKIVAYESASNSKSWERTLVLSADNQAESWEAVFETMNEDAAALLPAGMATPERFYLQEYENESLAVTDLTAELLAAVEAGALIVNYAGHGSVNLWATERVLDNRGGAYRSDVATLTNSGMYPFVVNMSCLTGYFIYPQTGAYAADSWRSLAEGWLWPASAGAVAALMPTGMTDTDGQHLLVQCALRGDLHAGPPDAGPGGGLRAAAAAGQRGLAVRADEQHVHVVRGPGDRAEGAAAAAAAGVDGGVAGRRPGGADLVGGARLRRGRGLRLPPLPAQRRRSELHAGERGAARGAELRRRGGGRGAGGFGLLLRARRGGLSRRRECQVRPGRGHHPAGGRVRLRRRRRRGRRVLRRNRRQRGFTRTRRCNGHRMGRHAALDRRIARRHQYALHCAQVKEEPHMGMEQVFARDPNFVSRRIEAETILVPIRNNVGDLDCIFSLNPVGALVWEQLDGVATLGDIRDRIVGEYDVSATAAEADLNAFVAEMESIAAIRPVG